jgi:hypothetical protein
MARKPAVLRADPAAGALREVDVARLLADGRLEVADVAGDLFDLRVGHELYVRVVRDVHHLGRQDARRAVQGRESLVELAHVPAHRGRLLDDVDLEARVRDIECGLDAGYPCADHEAGRDDVHFLLLESLEQQGFGDGGLDQFLGLLRRFGVVFVDPRALLAYVGHLEEVRVQPRFLECLAEGRLVHPGGARGNDHPVEPLILDVVLDQVLARVRAHVGVLAGDSDPRQTQGMIDHRWYVHD